ncbi:MAG TPA: hypothetical protein VFP72_22125 [Kineosporiaceae bacterium]|nr:hypothetical protein [Kineosporiaceae bacterium]
MTIVVTEPQETERQQIVREAAEHGWHLTAIPGRTVLVRDGMAINLWWCGRTTVREAILARNDSALEVCNAGTHDRADLVLSWIHRHGSRPDATPQQPATGSVLGDMLDSLTEQEQQQAATHTERQTHQLPDGNLTVLPVEPGTGDRSVGYVLDVCGIAVSVFTTAGGVRQILIETEYAESVPVGSRTVLTVNQGQTYSIG